MSKRFMPATLNFLCGMLYQAIPRNGMKFLKPPPPFSTSYLLVVAKNIEKSEKFESLKMDFSNMLSTDIEEAFKIQILYANLKILGEFYTHLENLPSSVEIFNPALTFLEAIPIANYPELVRSTHEHCISLFKNGRALKQITYIVMQAMKPKALRMLEPKIEKT